MYVLEHSSCSGYFFQYNLMTNQPLLTADRREIVATWVLRFYPINTEYPPPLSGASRGLGRNVANRSGQPLPRGGGGGGGGGREFFTGKGGRGIHHRQGRRGLSVL